MSRLGDRLKESVAQMDSIVKGEAEASRFTAVLASRFRMKLPRVLGGQSAAFHRNLARVSVKARLDRLRRMDGVQRRAFEAQINELPAMLGVPAWMLFGRARPADEQGGAA